MTPGELAQALTIRRMRERKAETALRRAQAVVAQCRAARDGAVQRLEQFDQDLEARLNAFYERSSTGIDPNRIRGMRAFHSDQRLQRGVFIEAIGQADQVVANAERLLDDARARWQRASNAAENLQDFSGKEKHRLAREASRRDEMDVDEMVVGLGTRQRQE